MSKVKILALSTVLLIAGYSIGKSQNHNEEILIKNAINTGKKLISEQKYIEARTILGFIQGQRYEVPNGIIGQIDTLLLAQEDFEKEAYESATARLKSLDENKNIESGILRGVVQLQNEINIATNQNEKEVENENKVASLVQEKIEWESVNASSYLSGKSKDYSPKRAIDGNIKTAWIENGPAERINGEGEFIELSSTNAIRVDEIHMINGLANGLDTYNKNNRVKKIKIELYNNQKPSDIKTVYHTFEDGKIDYQVVPIGGIEASSIKIYIEEVFTNGSQYNDTCISEIITYGQVINQE